MARGVLLSIVLLVGCVPASPSVGPGGPIGGLPTTVHSVSSSSTASPVASASALAMPTASPVASLPPTPTPDPTALDLEVTSCPGGVVLHWTVSQHPDFHHYSALRSPERTIDPAWPPIAPAVDWGDSYTTDRFVTSAADASIIPSATTWYYRAVAYDATNRVLAASPVRHAVLDTVAGLDPLRATIVDDRVRLTWAPFPGRATCFSQYRVLVATGGPPSVLATVSGQESAELVTAGLRTGTTYQLRVEAVRNTTLGSFVVATSDTLAYTVP